MNYLFFLVGLSFILFPLLGKSRYSFVDNFILFCLYFDAIAVFYTPSFFMSQGVLVLLFSAYYFVFQSNPMPKHSKRLFLITLMFLTTLLLAPLAKGEPIISSLVSFARNYASMIILPIAFHYYATKGNIFILLRNGYRFIVAWVLIVLVFTLFQIDHVYDPLASWDHMGSETFGGGIFYFGNMGRRGAITYIGFALLLVPLLYKHGNLRKRNMLVVASGFLLAIMLIALKRFTFVVVILGLANYLFKSSVSLNTKLGVSFGAVSIVVFLFLATDVFDLTLDTYERRGHETFTFEQMQSDIRVYETLYVYNHIKGGSWMDLFFGREVERRIDIETDSDVRVGWQVHNQYAQYLLLYGFSGLVLYISLFVFLYRRVKNYKNRLIQNNININDFWIAFQNIWLIFALAGMVGGHVHVTFRGMVFLFAGGIGGYFYKLLKEETKKTT